MVWAWGCLLLLPLLLVVLLVLLVVVLVLLLSLPMPVLLPPPLAVPRIVRWQGAKSWAPSPAPAAVPAWCAMSVVELPLLAPASHRYCCRCRRRLHVTVHAALPLGEGELARASRRAQ
jgi:hypothetical protein